MSADTVLRQIEADLPAILYRNHPDFRALTGVTPRTMANLDSAGQGPAERVRQGRTVGYPRTAVLEWLRRRLTVDHVAPRGEV